MVARVFCSMMLLFLCENSRAADESAAVELMAAMIKTCEAIDDGSFSATIHISLVDPGRAESARTSRISSSFNFSRLGERWLCEQERLVDVRDSSELSTINNRRLEELAQENETGSARIQKVVTQAVRNSEYMAQWKGIGENGSGVRSSLNIRSPDHQHDVLSEYFDIRSSCFLSDSEFQHGFTHSQVMEKWQRDSIPSVEQVGDLTRVAFTKGRYRRSFYADPAKGLTCQRMEFVELTDEGSEKEWPKSTSETEWQLKDGFWVPVRFSFFTEQTDRSQRTTVCTIEWNSINTGEYDPTQYEYSSLDKVWHETPVREWRAGVDGMQIGVVGQPPDLPPTSVPTQSRTNKTLALISVIMLAVFAILLARSFRDKSHAE